MQDVSGSDGVFDEAPYHTSFLSDNTIWLLQTPSQALPHLLLLVCHIKAQDAANLGKLAPSTQAFPHRPGWHSDNHGVPSSGHIVLPLGLHDVPAQSVSLILTEAHHLMAFNLHCFKMLSLDTAYRGHIQTVLPIQEINLKACTPIISNHIIHPQWMCYAGHNVLCGQCSLC